MPQSLSNILVHVVFSTKDRTPFFKPEMRAESHAYLATVVRGLGCECYRVGGIEDHVHLAVRLSRTIEVADLIEGIKTPSSGWMKHRFPKDAARFSWQRGYGAFSADPEARERLLAYIDNQAEHHRHISFQDEYRDFLHRYEIPYDEQYVWD